jgi:hypothetical protein
VQARPELLPDRNDVHVSRLGKTSAARLVRPYGLVYDIDLWVEDRVLVEYLVKVRGHQRALKHLLHCCSGVLSAGGSEGGLTGIYWFADNHAS